MPAVSTACTVRIDEDAGGVTVRWADGTRSGSCRFDRLGDAHPNLLAAADDLLDGLDRRTERRVLDGVARALRDAGLEAGLWHDDQGIEYLSDPAGLAD